MKKHFYLIDLNSKEIVNSTFETQEAINISNKHLKEAYKGNCQWIPYQELTTAQKVLAQIQFWNNEGLSVTFHVDGTIQAGACTVFNCIDDFI